MKLPKITYKPGVEVTLAKNCADGIDFHVTRLVTDADGQFKGDINLQFTFSYYSKNFSEDEMKEVIYQGVLAAETHELCEWLRFNGKRIKEPNHGTINIDIKS